MARFTLPRDIFYGPGAISSLGDLNFSKAFVVTGGASMQSTGYLQKVETTLRAAGMQVRTMDKVEPDPSVETVLRGAEAMREFEPDLIVALGGGSPMDAAKAMWVFYEHPDKTFEDIKEPFSMPKLRRKARFAAVPSTSGTASEVTAFSVITDYSTRIKYPLADYEITPDIAVLDTDIPMSMPKKLTAHTGMDALTHAMEAYVSTAHSGFSDPLAKQSISDIFDSLLDSYHGDAEARSKMHIAQCLAGMAFSNALLGIAHSLAHKTGAIFELPHGLCNAILLPYVMEYNRKACMDRYAQIARMLHLPGGTDAQLTDSLLCAIRGLNAQLGIEGSYQKNGVSEEKLTKYADSIAKNAVADPCTGSNPRPINVESMKKLLLCAYYGVNVAF